MMMILVVAAWQQQRKLQEATNGARGGGGDEVGIGSCGRNSAMMQLEKGYTPIRPKLQCLQLNLRPINHRHLPMKLLCQTFLVVHGVMKYFYPKFERQ